MIDPLVVKHSLSRGSPIFSQKVAKRPPCRGIDPRTRSLTSCNVNIQIIPATELRGLIYGRLGVPSAASCPDLASSKKEDLSWLDVGGE